MEAQTALRGRGHCREGAWSPLGGVARRASPLLPLLGDTGPPHSSERRSLVGPGQGVKNGVRPRTRNRAEGGGRALLLAPPPRRTRPLLTLTNAAGGSAQARRTPRGAGSAPWRSRRTSCRRLGRGFESRSLRSQVAAMSARSSRSAPVLPAGLEEVLQGMAREVLRAQPDDVLGFITNYFQALLAEREQSSAPQRTEETRDVESKGVEAQGEEAEAPQSSAVTAGTVRELQRGPRDEDLGAELLTSQEAATKIQAAFRGYCTRRELWGLRRASEPPYLCPTSGPKGTL
ncbi:neurogranin isoform X1 [Numida meleagris]|uniref:neurogranin isoform X1 n=1 Tax=Numida meleagris TaxID=8996 RepID=UPI000B3DC0E5|nr:neurogranin isoform X1 [Numida meleagris]